MSLFNVICIRSTRSCDFTLYILYNNMMLLTSYTKIFRCLTPICSKLIKIKRFDFLHTSYFIFTVIGGAISHLIVPGLIHANTQWALGASGYKYSEHTTFQNTDGSFFILMKTPSNVPCIKHEHPILHLGSICLNRSAITNTIMLVKVICLLVFNSSSTDKSVTSTGMQMAVGEAVPAWKTGPHSLIHRKQCEP